MESEKQEMAHTRVGFAHLFGNRRSGRRTDVDVCFQAQNPNGDFQIRYADNFDFTYSFGDISLQ